MAGQGRQFHTAEVEVITATVNLDEVLSYRGAISSVQVFQPRLAYVPCAHQARQ